MSAEYFPWFFSDERILFCSDREGDLALYSAAVDGSGLMHIAGDSVAAFRGIVWGGELVYASYARTGYVLKTTALEPKPVVPAPAPKLDKRTSEQSPEPVSFSPYRDRIPALFWLPLISASLEDVERAEIVGLESIAFGAGATVGGSSLLGRRMWTGSGLFFPTLGRIDWQFAASATLGAVTATYANTVLLNQVSTVDAVAAYSQILENRLRVVLPLIDRTEYGTSRNNRLSIGAEFGSDLEWRRSSPVLSFRQQADQSLADQSLADQLLGGQLLETAQRINLWTAVSWRSAQSGAPIDFYAPKEAVILASNQVSVAINPTPAIGTRTEGVVSLSAPSPLAHHVIRFGLKAAFVADSLVNELETLVSPRGLFERDPETYRGRGLVALDYLIPIALLDIPLLFGVYLTGVAAGLHVEALAGWDIAPFGLAGPPTLYFGIELSPFLDSWSLLPASAFVVGMSLRIRPADIRLFDAAQDIRPYFLLGTDSFRTNWSKWQ